MLGVLEWLVQFNWLASATESKSLKSKFKSFVISRRIRIPRFLLAMSIEHFVVVIPNLATTLFLFHLKRSISRLKAPFLPKELRGSTYTDLTSEYSTYRGDLYSLEEVQMQFPCQEVNQEKSPPQDKEIDSHDVEVVARIAFVVAFVVFNFFYWIVLVYFVWG